MGAYIVTADLIGDKSLCFFGMVVCVKAFWGEMQVSV